MYTYIFIFVCVYLVASHLIFVTDWYDLPIHKEFSILCGLFHRFCVCVLIDSCFGLEGITVSWGVGSEVQRIMGIVYLVPVSQSLSLTSE